MPTCKEGMRNRILETGGDGSIIFLGGGGAGIGFFMGGTDKRISSEGGGLI